MLCKIIIIVHRTPYPSIETWAAEEEESEEAGWTHFQIWATSSSRQQHQLGGTFTRSIYTTLILILARLGWEPPLVDDNSPKKIEFYRIDHD